MSYFDPSTKCYHGALAVKTDNKGYSLTDADYKKYHQYQESQDSNYRNKNKNKFYLDTMCEDSTEDSAEENEYDPEWLNTELKDPNTTPLLAQDIKQLLITRGEEKKK
eukprot:172940_1